MFTVVCNVREKKLIRKKRQHKKSQDNQCLNESLPFNITRVFLINKKKKQNDLTSNI